MFDENINLRSFAFLFRRTPNFDENFNIENLKVAPIDFSRIRCPLCKWQPKSSNRWFCADDVFHPGCGTAWNTFDTRGVCPGCNYQWRWTDCLRCYKSSPHGEWYEDSE